MIVKICFPSLVITSRPAWAASIIHKFLSWFTYWRFSFLCLLSFLTRVLHLRFFIWHLDISRENALALRNLLSLLVRLRVEAIISQFLVWRWDCHEWSCAYQLIYHTLNPNIDVTYLSSFSWSIAYSFLFWVLNYHSSEYFAS